MTRCMRPAPRSRKASCRAAASRWRAPRPVLHGLKADNDDQNFGIEIVRKAIADAAAPDRRECRRGRRRHRRQGAGEGRVQLGLRRADGRVQGPGGRRHHRPDQGRAHGAAGCGLGRRPAGHDRGDGRRASGEEGRRRCRAVAAWAAWAIWTSNSPGALGGAGREKACSAKGLPVVLSERGVGFSYPFFYSQGPVPLRLTSPAVFCMANAHSKSGRPCCASV